MTKQHTETAFETAIEAELLGAGNRPLAGDAVAEPPAAYEADSQAGYIKGDPDNFDRERALD